MDGNRISIKRIVGGVMIGLVFAALFALTITQVGFKVAIATFAVTILVITMIIVGVNLIVGGGD